MRRFYLFLIAALAWLIIGSCATRTREVWLDELKIRTFSEGIPAILPAKCASGDSILLGGRTYARGIGTNSVSVLEFLLNGQSTQFSALVGPDDRANREVSQSFWVLGDRKILFESGPMKTGDTPKPVNVDLRGIRRLGLLVTTNGPEGAGKTFSDWAEARFLMKGDSLPRNIPNNDERTILTPPVPPAPRINSPGIFGNRPGNPFLYAIAATGKRPLTFTAEGLPHGLTLDPASGIITGKISSRGRWQVMLKAVNEAGEATKTLEIRAGDTICLTPPIGWNGWNSWARNIDRGKVVASADAMVKMGLRDHGWTYINIDDAWQGPRGGKWNALQPNEKFPDFTGMVGYIHSLGLKAGVYSTPWITSYAGFPGGSSDFENGVFPDSVRENKRAYRHVGKYRFEVNDARQMADWGVDYLKYDWRIDQVSTERMSNALKESGRDIVYSLSNSAPFAQARAWSSLANVWRTGPDIRDSWLSLYTSAFTIDQWAPWAGPGHWNDPDMLILGNVTTGTDLHPTRLTPDEQYSHVSIFCLLAAPLLIGCPIEQLDTFTLSLLTNDEVLAIDQDPLGKPGRLIFDGDSIKVWCKPLKDGSFAVGIFNTGGFGHSPQSYFRWGDEQPAIVRFDFSMAGLTGSWRIRDLWRQKDMGTVRDSFTAQVRHHGVVLFRMIPDNETLPQQGTGQKPQ